MKKENKKIKKPNTNSIKRYNPDILTGLSNNQIEERIDENLINYDTAPPTKTIPKILYDNFFTLFNIINLVLAICVFAVGSYKNTLFLLIVIINTAISTIQEIHAKKVVDNLSLMSSSKSTVIRNSKKEQIDIHKIVLDDILELKTGDQIATDCIIQNGELEINESIITGEPNSILKKAGDMILSGSYVVSGKAFAKVEHVANDNYTAQISNGAKYIKKVKSEIMSSLKKIIKTLTFAIVPIGILFFINQLHLSDNNLQDAVIKSVAAIIGMIPEGLVLLTSTVLAISVTRLSKSKVLVQELYCIETLARVDTLCLDKTGTLTEGSMELKKIIPINENKENIDKILYNLSTFSIDSNPTINAIKDYCNQNINTEKWLPEKIIPFSSEKKWSGISFNNNYSYVIGAPEFVLKDNFDNYKKDIKKYQSEYRLLVLAKSKESFIDKNLPNNLEVLGFICITDKIRKDAKKTIEYFKKQNVDIKIISGDNPATVSKIGKKVGLNNYEKFIDMSNIKDEEIPNIVLKYSIFGRVSPNQKKLLIESLKEKGKTVAMTGDGVNDVLALKTADCSIAMANGSDASKNVSQLILLDSNFSSMPKVVQEGRRSINNIERSASLFLVKTIYSCINAFLFLLIGEQYPFEPIQLSLISTITIGIPSFILALEPNKERIKGNFIRNVVSNALPTALSVVVSILSLTMLNKFDIITNELNSSLCVISTGIYGLLLLFTLTKRRKNENSKLPFSIFRLVLDILMFVLFTICITKFNDLFNIIDFIYLKPIVFKLILSCIINFTILNIITYAINKNKIDKPHNI